jgi:hypothetical protein
MDIEAGCLHVLVSDFMFLDERDQRLHRRVVLIQRFLSRCSLSGNARADSSHVGRRGCLAFARNANERSRPVAVEDSYYLWFLSCGRRYKSCYGGSERKDVCDLRENVHGGVLLILEGSNVVARTSVRTLMDALQGTD